MAVDGATLFIAFYGAILSTIALVWNVLRDKADRAKIKVTTALGFAYMGGKTSDTLFTVTAATTGKRPITLSGAGIRIEDGKSLIFTNNTKFPIRLQEGESTDITMEHLKDLQKQLAGHKPKYAWVRDQTGKLHRSKGSHVSKVLSST